MYGNDLCTVESNKIEEIKQVYNFTNTTGTALNQSGQIVSLYPIKKPSMQLEHYEPVKKTHA